LFLQMLAELSRFGSGHFPNGPLAVIEFVQLKPQPPSFRRYRPGGMREQIKRGNKHDLQRTVVVELWIIATGKSIDQFGEAQFLIQWTNQEGNFWMDLRASLSASANNR
jgi:hypothetical protein